MLVSIPPKMSVSKFMGCLKGKSALMIFERHANLKYKFGKGDKAGNRLHYYCFEDNATEIYWMIIEKVYF